MCNIVKGKYYKLVNDFIDKYIIDWKIKPSKLAIYLKNNSKFEKFLIKNGLKEVWNINRIINDVIEDRTGLEHDGVLKFEKYSLLKENLIELNSADISYEKTLADYYNIGLSHISLFRKDLNLFRVNDFDETKLALIYSKTDLIKNLESIRFTIQKSILSDVYDIPELDGFSFGLDLILGDVIDNNKLINNLDKVVNENLFLIILKQNLKNIYKRDFKEIQFGAYCILEMIKN